MTITSLAIVSEYKSNDFISLAQGSMTMEQYAVKFIEIGRFVLHLISMEDSKISDE